MGDERRDTDPEGVFRAKPQTKPQGHCATVLRTGECSSPSGRVRPSEGQPLLLCGLVVFVCWLLLYKKRVRFFNQGGRVGVLWAVYTANYKIKKIDNDGQTNPTECGLLTLPHSKIRAKRFLFGTDFALRGPNECGVYPRSRIAKYVTGVFCPARILRRGGLSNATSATAGVTGTIRYIIMLYIYTYT